MTRTRTFKEIDDAAGRRGATANEALRVCYIRFVEAAITGLATRYDGSIPQNEPSTLAKRAADLAEAVIVELDQRGIYR